MASVLCIDDDPRILDLYKTLLEAKGYTVLTAPDGPTGLAITRKYSINVVVLDLRTAVRIHTRIIMVSGL